MRKLAPFVIVLLALSVLAPAVPASFSFAAEGPPTHSTDSENDRGQGASGAGSGQEGDIGSGGGDSSGGIGEDIASWWEDTKDNVGEWWEDTKDNVGEWWEDTKDNVGEWWEGARDYLGEFWETVVELYETVWWYRWLVNVIGLLVVVLVCLVALPIVLGALGVGATLAGVIASGAAWAAALAALSNALDEYMTGTVKSFGQYMTDLGVSAVFGAISAGVGSAFAGLSRHIPPLFNYLKAHRVARYVVVFVTTGVIATGEALVTNGGKPLTSAQWTAILWASAYATVTGNAHSRPVNFLKPTFPLTPIEAVEDVVGTVGKAAVEHGTEELLP